MRKKVTTYEVMAVNINGTNEAIVKSSIKTSIVKTIPAIGALKIDVYKRQRRVKLFLTTEIIRTIRAERGIQDITSQVAILRGYVKRSILILRPGHSG